MPRVDVDGLTINYEVQGEGEPLLLIPYTSADHACWAFQLPAYTEHFSCIAIDLPGTGESDKPPGPYSTEGQADQVAAFLGASVPEAPFDLVLIDPPYDLHGEDVNRVLSELADRALVAPDATVVVERRKSGEPLTLPEGWRMEKERAPRV